MIKGYKYRNEMGAIIDGNNRLLHMVDGSAGSVDFPEEVIWALHQMRPGLIFKLAHTHPPDMSNLSGRDKQTLKTWAFTLYPFPIRMSTITQIEDYGFLETTYFARLEPKESWVRRGKKTARWFEILIEGSEEFYIDSEMGWRGVLVEKSYEEPPI